MEKYAGIGSRKTPKPTLALMIETAEWLGEKHWMLRSGHANGADLAFEQGCLNVGGKKEIYKPWKTFNDRGWEGPKGYYWEVTREAMNLASTVHPAWQNCNETARLFHGRNCYQILGRDLDDPVTAVLCWTEFGQAVGGTATAINLAKRYDVPILNLGDPKNAKMALDDIKEWIEEL